MKGMMTKKNNRKCWLTHVKMQFGAEHEITNPFDWNGSDNENIGYRKWYNAMLEVFGV